MYNIPFSTIDWTNVPKTEHNGHTGMAIWQTLDLDGLRIRLVEYSADYIADHWCQKGHIVHCLEGEFVSEMEAGEIFTLTKGMTYIVSDDLSSHRSISAEGVKLLIVDGAFLKPDSQRKNGEAAHISIVPYESKYRSAFRTLNEAWISKYFIMEPEDYKVLNNPEGYMVNKKGHILVALYHDEPVGVCALIKMDDPDYDYELVKMAVSPAAQGKNIGWLLGQAVLNKAKSLGARSVFLESNTILKPAINLYLKLGFEKVIGRTSPYERANIQMGIRLDDW